MRNQKSDLSRSLERAVFLLQSFMKYCTLNFFQVLSLLFFFIALVEIVVVIYLWLCVISLHQVLGSDDWDNRDNWEMKPRFSTKYNGVPTNEQD